MGRGVTTGVSVVGGRRTVVGGRGVIRGTGLGDGVGATWAAIRPEQSANNAKKTNRPAVKLFFFRVPVISKNRLTLVTFGIVVSALS